jgi:hypothetical protein
MIRNVKNKRCCSTDSRSKTKRTLKCGWEFIRTYLGKNAALKTAHVEQQIWVVLGVDTDKAVFPLDCSCGSWQPVFDVPENGTATEKKNGTQT